MLWASRLALCLFCLWAIKNAMLEATETRTSTTRFVVAVVECLVACTLLIANAFLKYL